ncbi:MAG: hypothetical protein HZC05_02710 [Candidatus Magasanikbacteria bacterium]|nr:hypothetical protein [Candidatus Magasanikbacteria bacterium]
MFSPHAYFTPTNSPPQELQSVIGYTWAYNWAIGDNSIVEKGVLVGVAQEFKAKNKNGITQVGATAQISDGTQKSASSTVEVFICENPWPDATFNVAHSEFGLGYIDAEGTDDGILPDNGWTNFKLMYCRDAGKPNDPSDDLPELNKPTVVSHKNDASGIFKEFFATFAPPPTSTDIKEDKNSIGLRVYSNINHLPLVKWYQAVPAEAPGSPTVKGAPTPAQVGPYKALQEGRTYYIDGLNSSTDAAGKTTLYSNIYVFSFSDNPTAETLNIVNQLLANFTLNVNVADKDVVGKMYRDYTRLQDLKLIADKLWSYYQDPKKGNGAYPKLTENPQLGTFLPSYTNSKWKSWQGVLGNLVGYTLPVDPLNGFNGCANSTLSVGTPPVNLGPFDAETCWNAANSTFVCPSGSQVYEYETTGGTEAKLKADFELPQYIWNKKLVDLKPASPCEPNNCQITSGKCTNNNDACLKDSDCSLDVCTAIVKRCVVDNKICASDSDCVPSSCDLDYQISGNCNNTVEGNSIKCGDGIVGSGEKCEIGAQQYLDCSISGYPGKQSQKCKADCSNWENAGSCVPQGKCGDGVKQGAEKCDDGKNNGKYGYCKTDCSGTSAEFCGNNKLDTGKEACDLNGAVYNAQKDLSCSWDCQNWDYCGDGVVHKPYEQCEKSESCQVGTCDDSYKSIEKKEGFCEKDSDCVVSQPVQVPLPQGGTKAVQQVQNPDAKCLDYKSGKRYCGVATEFIPVDAPGHSPPYYYKDSDTKFSGYSGESYINCDWWGTDTFIDNRASNSVTCLPLEKPTAPTIPSSCGNGKIEAGEVCDDGANNGVECDWIANAKTCTYCAFGCQQVITKTKP